ncbi:hypothetical protein WDW86_13575 [Bdellovibrionota bacterium FG-2]
MRSTLFLCLMILGSAILPVLANGNGSAPKTGCLTDELHRMLTVARNGAPTSPSLIDAYHFDNDRFLATPESSYWNFEGGDRRNVQPKNLSGLTIQDVVDSKGDLFLFRSITQPYQPGVIGSWSEGLVYCTPDPLRAFRWNSGGNEDYVLILVQNLSANDLQVRVGSKVNRPEFIGKTLRTGNESAETALIEGWFPFETIDYEIAIPLGREKVLVALPKKLFADYLSEFLIANPDSKGPKAAQDFAKWVMKTFKEAQPH